MCGVILKEPTDDEGECSRSELKDEKIDKMLAKDLSTLQVTQRSEFTGDAPRKHRLSLFISDYCEISGVTDGCVRDFSFSHAIH